jgi:hypothetical protein
MVIKLRLQELLNPSKFNALFKLNGEGEGPLASSLIR